jgi:Chaperone of endosialidase
MSVNVSWPPIGGTTYPIPNTSGEVNWTSLTNFLQALGNNAQGTTTQKVGVRVATTSPITVSGTTDYVVVSNLGTPGAVTVNLPAATVGQVFIIKDGKGDAATNNITINRNGSDTIDGATTVVINSNYGSVMLMCTTSGVWNVHGYPLTGGAQTISGVKTFTDTLVLGPSGVTATIRTNTSDGSDNKRLQLTGGGSVGPTRGAYIELYGNDYGSSLGGRIILSGGDSADVAGSNIAIRFDGSSTAGAGSTTSGSMTGNGAWTLGPPSSTNTNLTVNGSARVLMDDSTLRVANAADTRGAFIGHRSGTDVALWGALGTSSVVFRVNGNDVGGIDATIVGKTTIGRSAGLGTAGAAYHKIWGSMVAAGSSYGCYSSDGVTEICANAFRDASDIFKAPATATGYVQLLMQRAATSGSTALVLNTNYQDAQTANSAIVTTNQKTPLTITHAGAFTIGDASADVTHVAQNTSTANSTLLVKNNSTSTSADNIAAFLVRKGSATATAGSQRFINFEISAGGTLSGYIGSNGANAAAFFSTSDRRLKTDISDLPGGLSIVMAMRPVNFKWRQDGSSATGFIAQELAAVAPQFVCKTDDGSGDELPEGQQPWNMTESGMSAFLVKAIQELKKELDATKSRIKILESKSTN